MGVKMGTTIKIQAFKGESTTTEQWEQFTEKFITVYEDVTESELEFIEASCVYTSYRNADLDVQMASFEEFKGSGIEFHLYYLESDPDEQKTL